VFLQDDALVAYQIAFDLVENENQAFLLNVRNHLDTLSISNLALPGGQTSNAATEPSGDIQMGDDVDIMNGSPQVVDPVKEACADRLTKIRGILSGETSIQLTLQFLYSHNR
jgi:26S proteasome regulatory subunit N2